MKSKGSYFRVRQLISLLTLDLCLLQMVFKEKFAPLILSNISLEVLSGKHPAYLKSKLFFLCLWAKTLQQGWPLWD